MASVLQIIYDIQEWYGMISVLEQRYKGTIQTPLARKEHY